ncbi:MAG: CaiB/BaiF CoA transferase family protein [Hyphomicrobiaceae bacterium]
MTARPLEGLRVVDLTHVIAGPFAAHQLAALGADVVKVEHPDEPDMARAMGVGAEAGMGAVFRAHGAGKKAVSLDFSTSAGLADMHALLADSDVLIENYRAGALDRFGLDYGTLRTRYPHLIYCSITGFGQHGARRGLPAYDNVIQASSGLMSLNGGRIGAPVIDYATGLTAAFAISAALAQRGNDGLGQHIDVVMQDVALTLASAAVLRVSENKSGDNATLRPAQRAEGHPGLACYETSDGMVMIGALNARQLARTAALLDAPPNLLERAALASDGGHERARLFLADRLATATAEEWEQRFNLAGVPAQRVRTLATAVADARASGDGHLSPVSEGSGLAPVAGFRLSGARLRHDLPPPAHGAHNAQPLGVGWSAWNALKRAETSSASPQST